MPLQNALIDITATLKTRLVEVGHTHCDRHWAPCDIYNDPFGRIYWLVDGSGWVEHHDRHIELLPGKLFVIPEHTPSRYGCPQSMELYWLHYTAHVLQNIDLFTFLGEQYEVDVADILWTRQLWERLLRRYNEETPGRHVACDGMLRELLSTFIDSADASDQASRVNGVSQFRQVLVYIEQRLPDRISLGELADVAGLHPTYFSNLFTKHMGIAPITYVNRRRVERARALLVGTSMSLREIAERVGFCDEYYFARTFKLMTKLTPGQYRRLQSMPRP